MVIALAREWLHGKCNPTVVLAPLLSLLLCLIQPAVDGSIYHVQPLSVALAAPLLQLDIPYVS